MFGKPVIELHVTVSQPVPTDMSSSTQYFLHSTVEGCWCCFDLVPLRFFLGQTLHARPLEMSWSGVVYCSHSHNCITIYSLNIDCAQNALREYGLSKVRELNGSGMSGSISNIALHSAMPITTIFNHITILAQNNYHIKFLPSHPIIEHPS